MPVQHGKLSGMAGPPVDPQRAMGLMVQAEMARAQAIERSFGAIGRGMALGAKGLVDPSVQAKRDERLHGYRMHEAGVAAAQRSAAAERKAMAEAMGKRAGSLAALHLATTGTPGLGTAKVSPHRAMFPVNTQEDTVNLYAGDRDPTGEQGLRPQIEQTIKGMARPQDVFWFDQREVPGLVQRIALEVTGSDTIDKIPPEVMAAIEGGVQERVGSFPTSIEEAAQPLLKQAQGQLSSFFGTAAPAMQQRQEVPYGPAEGTPGATDPYPVTADLLDKIDMDAAFPGGVPGASYGDVARKAFLQPDPQTGAPTMFDPETGTFPQSESQFHRRVEEMMREDSPMGTDLREAFMLGATQPGWVTSKAEMKKVGKERETQAVLAKPVPPLKPGAPTGPGMGKPGKELDREDVRSGPGSLESYLQRARGGG